MAALARLWYRRLSGGPSAPYRTIHTSQRARAARRRRRISRRRARARAAAINTCMVTHAMSRRLDRPARLLITCKGDCPMDIGSGVRRPGVRRCIPTVPNGSVTHLYPWHDAPQSRRRARGAAEARAVGCRARRWHQRPLIRQTRRQRAALRSAPPSAHCPRGVATLAAWRHRCD